MAAPIVQDEEVLVAKIAVRILLTQPLVVATQMLRYTIDGSQ